MPANADPKNRPLLSSEELDLLRSLFATNQGEASKGPPRIPLAKGAWDDQGALLTYLKNLGEMGLTAEKGHCKMNFPVRLLVDENGEAALHIASPSLVESHPNATRMLRVTPSPDDVIQIADLHGRFTLPRILNLSVTGLCVADNFTEAPKVGEVLDDIILSLPGGTSVQLKAKVVRVAPPPDNQDDPPPPTHSVALQLFEEPDGLGAYVFHRYWQNSGSNPEDDPFR